MSHNILQNLNVDILFAHACTERMPQDMSTNLWKVARLTFLFQRFCILFLVVGGCDTLDRVINKGLCVDLSVVIADIL